MPPDDYKAVTSGALKLKGVNSTSKISKSHKKKKPKATQEANPTTLKQPGKNTVMETENGLEADGGVDCETGQEVKGLGGEDEVEGEMALRRLGKTEAELRHEEQRRRRLDERLKREGTKTHKERVEELNRYLSNLSEHHDMPRIGPG